MSKVKLIQPTAREKEKKKQTADIGVLKRGNQVCVLGGGRGREEQ